MSKPSLDTPTVEQLLQNRWGKVTDVHPLTGGLTSQVFGFSSDNVRYVVRISSSVTSFQKDAFASQRFASPDLPIPQILDIGEVENGVYFCISQRASGTRLKDLDAADIRRMANEAAQIISVIGDADLTNTEGFGHFNAHGVAPFSSWQNFLLEVTDVRVFNWNSKRNIDRAMVGKATDAVSELAEHCPEIRCLIHGDLGSYNILTDAQRITAVIDWDLGLFGDPLYEIANLFFWHEDHLTPLLKQLGGTLRNAPKWRERVLCYQLHIGLHELFYERYDIDWLTNRCTELLDNKNTA